MSMVTIIQARMGSSRLPGKVLERVGDRTVLGWVVYRLGMCQETLGRVVIATSARGGDNAIADAAEAMGVDCFRGSERDVLNRYHQAALHYGASSVLRVTADCPLLCPNLVDALVRRSHDSRQQADIYRVRDEHPVGVGEEEIIAAPVLHAIQAHAALPEDREHVTTWAVGKPEYTFAYIPAPDHLFDHQELRLCVDTPEDLALLRRLYTRSKGQLFDYSSQRVVAAALAESWVA